MHDAAEKRRANSSEAQKINHPNCLMLKVDPQERIKPEEASKLLSQLSQTPNTAAAQSIHEKTLA